MKELSLWTLSNERSHDQKFYKELEIDSRFDRLEKALNELIRQFNIRDKCATQELAPAKRLTASQLAKQQKPGF